MFAFDENNLSLMRDVITIRNPLRDVDGNIVTNRAGEQQLGAPVQYRAQVDGRPRTVRNSEGELTTASNRITVAPAQVTSTDLILLDQMPAIDTEAEITMPDGSKPPILQVDRRSTGENDDDLAFQFTVVYTA
jgi:hypothetical protein